MPHRVQRKQIKGWRMPLNTVSVTRPGPFGNPFRVGADHDATSAVVAYEKWLNGEVQGPGWATPPTRAEIQQKLRGKNLACFCALDQPCHADVLLKIERAEAR